MVDRIMAFQRCPLTILSTYKYVTLHGKRDFVDMTKLRILTWEDYWVWGREDSVITRILIRGGHEGLSQIGDVTMTAEVGVMCFENGGRSHEPRNEGSL